MARIISFDLSLVASGFACAIDGKVVDHGIIAGKGTGMLREMYNRNRVMEKVEAIRPDLVVMEDIAFSKNNAMASQIIGMAHLIRAELVGDKISYVLVASTSLKKFATGSGSAPKDTVIKEVFKRWGHDVNDNNIADALAVCYLGMALLGDWTPTMKAQEEVLATIRKNQSVPVKQNVEGW